MLPHSNWVWLVTRQTHHSLRYNSVKTMSVITEIQCCDGFSLDAEMPSLGAPLYEISLEIKAGCFAHTW